MGWGDIQGDWDGQKRRVRERWSRLAEHEIEEIGGERDRLLGRIQDVYGVEREEAEVQVREFEAQASPGRHGSAGPGGPADVS